jgi:hypothetical protein
MSDIGSPGNPLIPFEEVAIFSELVEPSELRAQFNQMVAGVRPRHITGYSLAQLTDAAGEDGGLLHLVDGLRGKVSQSAHSTVGPDVFDLARAAAEAQEEVDWEQGLEETGEMGLEL